MSVCCCCFNLNDPHLLNRALIVNVLLDTFILNYFFVFLFFTIVHGVDSQQCVSLQQSQTEWLLEQPEKLYFVRRTEDFQHHTLWNGRSSTTCRYSLRGHTRPGPGQWENILLSWSLFEFTSLQQQYTSTLECAICWGKSGYCREKSKWHKSNDNII